MSQAGLAVGVGIDCRSAAYGQTWDLTVETHRLRLAHLLNRQSRLVEKKKSADYYIKNRFEGQFSKVLWI